MVGGHGKTGRAVCSALAGRGAIAVPLGRRDWPDLPGAIAGCTAVHVIAPNMHPDEPAYVAVVLAAARASGVRRLVLHSVVAPYAPDMPHHLGKARAEDLVRRSGADWSLLQPGAYVQNFLPALQHAGHDPVLRVAYSPHSRFGLVDLLDVAEASATVLLDARHVGATYELAGPALVSVTDIAQRAAEVLGRPVAVEQLSGEEWAATAGASLDPRMREGLLAMFAHYDAHGLPAGSLALAALLGRTPTALRETLRRELAASTSPLRTGPSQPPLTWQDLPPADSGVGRL